MALITALVILVAILLILTILFIAVVLYRRRNPDFCVGDETCATGQVCSDGACVGEAGFRCDEDSECDPNNKLICSGICVPDTPNRGDPGSPCFFNDTCNSGYSCSTTKNGYKLCTVPPNTHCLFNEECRSGTCGANNLCTSLIANAFLCKEDYNCVSGNCDGYCTLANITSGSEGAPCVAGYPEPSRNASAAGCTLPLTCVNGTCTSNSAELLSGCNSTTGCFLPTLCTSENYCLFPTTCTTNFECLSGSCENKVCKSGPSQPCLNDDSCVTGAACIASPGLFALNWSTGEYQDLNWTFGTIRKMAWNGAKLYVLSNQGLFVFDQSWSRVNLTGVISIAANSNGLYLVTSANHLAHLSGSSLIDLGPIPVPVTDFDVSKQNNQIYVNSGGVIHTAPFTSSLGSFATLSSIPIKGSTHRSNSGVTHFSVNNTLSVSQANTSGILPSDLPGLSVSFGNSSFVYPANFDSSTPLIAASTVLESSNLVIRAATIYNNSVYLMTFLPERSIRVVSDTKIPTGAFYAIQTSDMLYFTVTNTCT